MLCKHSRRIGRKLRHKSDERRRYHMEDGTARSSWTAYARGGREQGVHLLETCSLYPLLIERSALGSTGVDWTHQQPLTIAPSRRLPPCLIYVRICMCVCVCVCVCIYIYVRAHETRELGSQKTPQNAALRGGWSSRGWLVRFQRVPRGRPFPMWVSYIGVRPGTYEALLDTGYWAKVIVRKVNGWSGHEYEIFIHDFDR